MKGNEAEYIIPLRKEVMKVAKYDRTKKAVIAVRQYIQKHTKSKNVLLGKELNKRLQKGGRKNVVSKVHVKVIKDKDKIRAELIGFPIELTKEVEEKKKDKKADKTEKAKILEKDEVKEEKVEKPAPKEEPKKEVAEKVRQENIVKKSDKPKNEKKK